MIDTKNIMDSDSLPSYVKVVVVETTSELRKLGPRVQHSSHIGFWKGRLTLVDLSTSYSMKIWIRFPQIIGFNQPKWGSRWPRFIRSESHPNSHLQAKYLLPNRKHPQKA